MTKHKSHPKNQRCLNVFQSGEVNLRADWEKGAIMNPAVSCCGLFYCLLDTATKFIQPPGFTQSCDPMDHLNSLLISLDLSRDKASGLLPFLDSHLFFMNLLEQTNRNRQDLKFQCLQPMSSPRSFT